MKRSFHFVFSIVIACAFAVSSMNAASSRENKRLQEGKITKIEAQHLVLTKFPGATIKKCELTRGKDHSVWILDVVKAGAHDATKVQVEGRSGAITP
ncbi:MAG: hypothetical protein H0U99_05580 [Chthoniobacterales bacterium]|nr:hypothetical protein [Chthoniobacterales bacterium]